MTTTISRGLVRYHEATSSDMPRDEAWQSQVDAAAACLAAAALQGGMPRVAATLNERQLVRYMAGQVARRRRMTRTKLGVVLAGWALALVAGCYIGLLT